MGGDIPFQPVGTKKKVEDLQSFNYFFWKVALEWFVPFVIPTVELKYDKKVSATGIFIPSVNKAETTIETLGD